MAVHNPKVRLRQSCLSALDAQFLNNLTKQAQFLPGWIKFSALVTVNLFVYTGNMYAVSGIRAAASKVALFLLMSSLSH